MSSFSISHETHLRYLRQTISLAEKSPPKPTNFRVGCVIVTFSNPPRTGPKLEEEVLSTGYTLELPGNTHAEQCALIKLAQSSNFASEINLSALFSSQGQASKTILYTSLEPCSKRLSGATPCVRRIISSGITNVIFGAKEPNTFIQDSQSCQILTEAGITWSYLSDLETQILQVAMAGHDQALEHPQQQTATHQPLTNQKEQDQQKTTIDAQAGRIRDIEQSVKSDSMEAAEQLERQKEFEGHGAKADAGREEPERKEEHLAGARNRKKRMMEAPAGSVESWR